MRSGLAALVIALAVAACGGGGGGGAAGPTPPGPDGSLHDTTVYSSAPGGSLPATVVEAAAVTRHTLTIRGAAIPYTATAGHLTARHPVSGEAEASFFYVAYTADGGDAATRPVTFFYNGGPGSASVWLHLGSFGPKRLATGNPASDPPTPFPLVDNAESLLDVSDLVFVDAVGSGYSQAIAPYTNQSFWGVDRDAAVFRDFVMRYLQANGREDSPKFLFGESYGTARTAVLAHLLETAGVALNGIVLQSAVMNYGSNCGVVSATISCAGYLPSYGAIGAHYTLVTPPPADLPSFMTQMRGLTSASYDPAVALWIASGTLPGDATLSQLSASTGVPASRWQSRFNLDPGTFQTTLLPHVLIGRYDARVSAAADSDLARGGDPSSAVIGGQFRTAIDNHLRNTLRYASASTYVLLSNAIASWDFSHDGAGLPDTVPDLAAAMAQNPALEVLAIGGYHDLATPFHQTERDLGRLGGPTRLTIRNYAGGHMTYLDDRTRAAQKADLLGFYRQAMP
ncbi:peptidase S10 [Piscinibacter sp. XHJ-5]|uniref:S10 family peptidase n=1 Tax=Piscinibacter sp. XHJ-5 TaxID=3037797 RepID=UPI002452B64D|nr:peptidase S10 [Piscinibacter sp. XHJ-5]